MNVAHGAGPGGLAVPDEVHRRRPGAPGARVRRSWDRPADHATISQLGRLQTGVIGDAMHRLGAMNATIAPMWAGAALAGPALTVWVRAGDNAVIHQAIALAEPGDVLVINAQGSLTHAVFGELMALACLARGVPGVIVDGAVRDAQSLADLNFPVFACGSCPSGPAKEGTGEIGYPVACGGVACAVGDVVIADADGVVVVPASDAGAVLRQAEAIGLWEGQQRAALTGLGRVNDQRTPAGSDGR